MPNLLDDVVDALYPDKYNEKMGGNSAMEIETQSPTTCEVGPGTVSLGFVEDVSLKPH